MKRLLTLAVIAFAVFYLLTQPASAADAVRGAGGVLQNAFDAIITFFNQLAR